MANDDKWMSIDDAASVAKVSQRTIQRRINKGIYPTKTVDGKRVVMLSDINDIEMLQVSQNMSQDEAVSRLEADKIRLQERVIELSQSVAELQADNQSLRHQLIERDRQVAELHRVVAVAQNQAQQLIERLQTPFWRRWFSRKALPAPENVVDMESDKES